MIQWVNSASGTFTLRVEWNGDWINAFASNTTTLSFLPDQRSIFVIESNSTINELTFDNNTSTLTFNVTGPSGTEGFVKAFIARSLLTNGTDLQAYIDSMPLNYTVDSVGDSWVFTFHYSHSTHSISIQLPSSSSSPDAFDSDLLLIGIIIVLAANLVFGIIGWHHLNRKKQDNSD